MSDNAPEFVGKVLMALCDILNVKQLRTMTYHPQSNGSVERAHQTLIRMVGKLDPKHKHRWPDHISSVCHSYNATRSQVTSGEASISCFHFWGLNRVSWSPCGDATRLAVGTAARRSSAGDGCTHWTVKGLR